MHSPKTDSSDHPKPASRWLGAALIAFLALALLRLLRPPAPELTTAAASPETTRSATSPTRPEIRTNARPRIVSSAPNPKAEEIVAAKLAQFARSRRELAHALADQHFNLGRFIRKGQTDDAATARLAVMEGQAQWLMYEVMGAKTGQSLRKDPGLVRMMANMGESGLSQYPELTSAPIYIRESLLFPYSRGFLFNARVIEKLGNDGFREVFARPPATTQHILHPDRYFARTEAVPVDLEPAPKGFKVLIEGTLGEFDCLVMFKQFGEADSAAARAERWRGGKFRVLEHRKTKEPLLQYTVAWENPAAAADFAALQNERKGAKTRIEQRGERVIVSEGMR